MFDFFCYILFASLFSPLFTGLFLSLFIVALFPPLTWGGSSSFCSLTSIDRFISSFFLQPVRGSATKTPLRIGKSTVTAAKFAPKLDRVVEDFSAGRKKASRRRSKIGQIKLTKKTKRRRRPHTNWTDEERPINLGRCRGGQTQKSATKSKPWQKLSKSGVRGVRESSRRA